MFRNLSTSTKLLALCLVFLISLAVTTYSLVVEKQIAVDFARKELTGNHYVATLRAIYDAILTDRAKSGAPTIAPTTAAELLSALTAAEAATGGELQTAGLEHALVATLREYWSGTVKSPDVDDVVLEALARARRLIVRIGDDSNLTLDPDLDSYYMQDIVVTKLPVWLELLTELQMLIGAPSAGELSGEERQVRLLALRSLLNPAVEDVQNNLEAAYRGNADGSLEAAANGAFENAVSATRAYLAGLSTGAATANPDSLDPAYLAAVNSVTDAWAIAQSELDRLLQTRIDGFLSRLRGSLALIGVLGGLSILIAVLTHRHIVRPLERLEAVARTVRETRDYGLRIDYDSRDEIGRLALAFNDMLSELAAAREREKSEHAELARVTRLTTMGAMTASIAHEVNQPLAAIVANSNAALRWLAIAEPDLDEARAALKRITRDGHRASEVIGSIRAMFKKEPSERSRLDLNDLAREVLLLAHGNLQARQISVETDLRGGLPHVLADRVQLQQVLLNLIINGAEAMDAVSDRERVLRVSSDVDDADNAVVTVADSGSGITPEDMARIFEPFFTTKASGMGMGLPICRSIVESHGGRLWATSLRPHGTAFHLALPIVTGGGG